METLRVGPGVPRPHHRLAAELADAARLLARGLLVGVGAGLGLTVWAIAGSFW